MSDLRYYLSLFLRRLPAFLLVAAVISAISVVVAVTLPPAYESQTRLFVEASQIPDALAPSTVSMPGQERLQLIEQRLLTRPNLLDIAKRLNVLENQSSMTPDEIYEAMNARTKIRMQAGRNEVSLMTISFEARSGQLAASVLNEYLRLIQESDLSLRQGRAGKTLDFFELEVDRLGKEMQNASGKILNFKNANADALPDSLDFRQQQRASLQERLEDAEREIFRLNSQRQQLISLFNDTTNASGVVPQTPTEQALAKARSELESALLVYSETNPRVKMLQKNVAKLEKDVENARASVKTDDSSAGPETGNPALDLQLAEIDTRVKALQEQKASTEQKIAELTTTIDRTPANAIMLEDLMRDYENAQAQYNAAVARLAQASTGERIEVLSRGERLTVIEQPSVPSTPTKPARKKIAAAGSAAGILLGFGLIALIELMNTAPRRPEDIIRKLEIWPMAAIPYTRTRREIVLQRGRKLAAILVILVGVPVAVWAVHVYYLPLDLLADKVMNKLGVRL
ncbi:GumC family protein [Albibacillus kandeliae]|uniref:GumC family protein n=1 Tax=Albibacillus kandeliae TaxID=2174228 RepID=UPI000D69F718|nr:lipopolysaccharide biosynthesis [Albibacillus kandeliae]